MPAAVLASEAALQFADHLDGYRILLPLALMRERAASGVNREDVRTAIALAAHHPDGAVSAHAQQVSDVMLEHWAARHDVDLVEAALHEQFLLLAGLLRDPPPAGNQIPDPRGARADGGDHQCHGRPSDDLSREPKNSDDDQSPEHEEGAIISGPLGE